MIKKVIQIAILLIILGSLVYGIYKNPELVLQKQTQENLLDIADKLDKEFETGTGTKN